ncbi:hypothetical protein FOMPIDRAFT_1014675 [Fomitopsis schrenkii]|uniref:Gfd2/YDR514C-like C-terminal domain-containing protein n=1 Tax=Fomitopsis schrenkii TaxID=2126942 RepID=S8FYW0_FOMSC|nr:hypothetical protein FOMPIDRAFT_1014675 [Fomitopsis schrenkii]
MSDVDVVWAQLRDCYDLHSIQPVKRTQVYVAYIEQFLEDGTAWYGRPWGQYFESFEAFLSFKWYACTVTDVDTGRSHVVTPLVDWFTFSKAIAARFGEKLPMLRITPMSVSPFETTSQRMHAVTDGATYRVLSSTLPALQLETQLTRTPHCPRTPKYDSQSAPTEFPVGASTQFGNSQVVLKAQLPRAIQAVISSLASPDPETTPNQLVLIGHGVSGDLLRLREMGINIPHNVLVVDTAAFERQLFASGQRPSHPYVMETASGRPRERGNTLSLCNTLKSLDVAAGCKLHNAGNDAMLCLLAFQLLLEPETEIPSPCKRQKARGALAHSPQTSPAPTTVAAFGIYI